jgi:glucosamine-6-phosphate deaminase
MTNPKDLYQWCCVPAAQLEEHPQRKVPFRIVKDSQTMGQVMAEDLAQEIEQANRDGHEYRAIIPCGPNCWYKPFEKIVNERGISLKHFVVFHMDECLDWEGQPLHHDDPYNFRTYMEKHFYNGIRKDLSVPEAQRFFLLPETMETVRKEIYKHEIDMTYGGWGQDGHIAYNQARRQSYSQLTLEQLRNSSIRIQVNNDDTTLALAQRMYGTAYQFVPPMSVTLGLKECLRAKKVRLFSDTGAWKQTALRVGLFSTPDTEYPLTLLQLHPDARLTATVETATHPISLHPEWRFKGIHDDDATL